MLLRQWAGPIPGTGSFLYSFTVKIREVFFIVPAFVDHAGVHTVETVVRDPNVVDKSLKL